MKDFRQTKLRRMLKGWKDMLKQERKAGDMMSRFLARMQFFDQAKAFQHWQ